MSNSHLPRPLHHQSRQQLEDFVLSGSWQNKNYKQTNTHFQNTRNQQNNFNATNFSHNSLNNESLFDLYNRNNLLLSACDHRDLQIVRKNPIAFQQNLINQNIAPSRKQIKARTMQNINELKEAHNQKDQLSKQAKMNEFLFNYRQKASQKKQKKMKFLDEMQKKLNQLEKQTTFLETDQLRQQKQIKSMINIRDDIKLQTSKNQLVGKLNTAIYQFQPEQQQLSQPKKIEQQMDNIQLNNALQENLQYNNYLLQLADNASRKSRSKQKNKHELVHITSHSKQKVKNQKSTSQHKKMASTFNRTQNSMNQTIKKSLQAPPKPVSSNKLIRTWKDMSQNKRK